MQTVEILDAWILFLRNKLGDHLPDQDVARDRIGKEQLLDMLEELSAAREELAELRLQSETTARCVANVTAQPGLPRVHTEGDVERDGFVDGVWQARREYCAAWAEGCGGLLDDVDFSVQFVRERAAELRAARQELAELRRIAESWRALQRGATVEAEWWCNGVPSCTVLDVDGDGVCALDVSEVLDEALRRQAAAACKRIELSDPLGTELGAALGLVPRDRDLIVRHPSDCEADAAWQEPFAAGPFDPPRGLATGYGPTREAAILAATRKLLGLSEDELRRRVSGSPANVLRAAAAWADRLPTDKDAWRTTSRDLYDAVNEWRGTAEPRPTCETCARWSEGEPARGGPSIARWCSLVAGYRQPDAWCDDHSVATATADTDRAPSSDEPPPLKGVSVAGNVVRSEGDGDA